MFCTRCGNQIDDSAKFCNSCGAAIEGTAQIQEEAVQQPEAPQAQHRGFKKPFSVATPGVSHPLRGDPNDTPDDGVTLPKTHIPYQG